MKRLFAFLIATVMTITSASFMVMADEKINLVVNGAKVDFSGDQEPVIENGRTLVPFRAVFEKMGAKVEWFSEIQLCEATYGEVTVGIYIGDTKVILGEGAEIESDVPAKIINGRTMVPLRILSESIGAEVNWDSESRTVTVNTPEISGEAPESVNYTTENATAAGKVLVNYQYPVITDKYTQVDVLNKNIFTDIETVASEIAASAETDRSELNIVFLVRHNSAGIFSVMYFIEDETVYWNNYGIVSGARISDDEYYMITDENFGTISESYSIESYDVSENGSDGYACINATIFYPKFNLEGDFIASLNTQLENSAKKAADSFVESYKEDALKIYENPPTHLFEVPYSLFGDCAVEITEDNVAIIKTEFSESKYDEEARNYEDIIKINLDNGEVIE
ncbi:MAG: copper amine oxidase N-terminal domain-containing protein [Lachnospirales bacterium]